jgi:hypothetical protein
VVNIKRGSCASGLEAYLAEIAVPLEGLNPDALPGGIISTAGARPLVTDRIGADPMVRTIPVGAECWAALVQARAGCGEGHKVVVVVLLLYLRRAGRPSRELST